MHLEEVLAAAREYEVALEVNANPHRLDLSDVHCRRAVEAGCKLVINTDALTGIHGSMAFAGRGTCRLNPGMGFGGYCPTRCPLGLGADQCEVNSTEVDTSYGACDGWCGSCTMGDKCRGKKLSDPTEACSCAQGC